MNFIKAKSFTGRIRSLERNYSFKKNLREFKEIENFKIHLFGAFCGTILCVKPLWDGPQTSFQKNQNFSKTIRICLLQIFNIWIDVTILYLCYNWSSIIDLILNLSMSNSRLAQFCPSSSLHSAILVCFFVLFIQLSMVPSVNFFHLQWNLFDYLCHQFLKYFMLKYRLGIWVDTWL